MGATGWPCWSWPVGLIINEWPGNNISKKKCKRNAKERPGNGTGIGQLSCCMSAWSRWGWQSSSGMKISEKKNGVESWEGWVIFTWHVLIRVKSVQIGLPSVEIGQDWSRWPILDFPRNGESPHLCSLISRACLNPYRNGFPFMDVWISYYGWLAINKHSGLVIHVMVESPNRCGTGWARHVKTDYNSRAMKDANSPLPPFVLTYGRRRPQFKNY